MGELELGRKEESENDVVEERTKLIRQGGVEAGRRLEFVSPKEENNLTPAAHVLALTSSHCLSRPHIHIPHTAALCASIALASCRILNFYEFDIGHDEPD